MAVYLLVDRSDNPLCDVVAVYSKLDLATAEGKKWADLRGLYNEDWRIDEYEVDPIVSDVEKDLTKDRSVYKEAQW